LRDLELDQQAITNMITGGEFLDQLIKNSSVPWSYL